MEVGGNTDSSGPLVCKFQVFNFNLVLILILIIIIIIIIIIMPMTGDDYDEMYVALTHCNLMQHYVHKS
jgi:hypothetical protein